MECLSLKHSSRCTHEISFSLGCAFWSRYRLSCRDQGPLLQQLHIQAKVSEFKSRASILCHDLSRDSKQEQSFRGLRLERLLNFLHTLVFLRTASFPTLQPLRARSTAKDRLSPSLVSPALVSYS